MATRNEIKRSVLAALGPSSTPDVEKAFKVAMKAKSGYRWAMKIFKLVQTSLRSAS